MGRLEQNTKFWLFFHLVYKMYKENRIWTTYNKLITHVDAITQLRVKVESVGILSLKFIFDLQTASLSNHETVLTMYGMKYKKCRMRSLS